MLDNTITIPVDILNTGTTTDRVYSRYSEFTDRSIYKGPQHTLVSRDTLGFYRVPIKSNGGNNGVAKSSGKLTQDIVVPGTKTIEVTLPMIGNFDFSIPVGATSAQTLEFRQRMIGVLDHAIATRLINDLEI